MSSNLLYTDLGIEFLSKFLNKSMQPLTFLACRESNHDERTLDYDRFCQANDRTNKSLNIKSSHVMNALSEKKMCLS